MKKIKLLHILILAEVSIIVYFLILLFTPHVNFVDLKNIYFIDKVSISESKMYNLYYMDVLDSVMQKANNKLDELNKKLLHLNYLNNNLYLELEDYLTVDDILVNNVSKDSFEFKINYLSNYREGYKVDLVTSLDVDRLNEDSIEYFNQFNEEMKKPVAKFENGSLIVTNNGEKGKELDKKDLKDKIKLSLNDYYNKDLLEKIDVTYNDIEVFPSVEDIKKINTKVSSFTTYYGSSGYSRKTNISVATRNTNGTLLAPGEEISVDKTFKSRNASNGYLPAGSYLNGKTVQTYGGGICQVSTTLYGAILRAGIIPIERNAHSMAVSYVPLGLDAAISEGYKDLKIKNTYDSPIYIQGVANGSALTFNIYGCEDLLGGYTYKPGYTSGKNGLYANSWLNKYKDGELVDKIALFESNYRPHS